MYACPPAGSVKLGRVAHRRIPLQGGSAAERLGIHQWRVPGIGEAHAAEHSLISNTPYVAKLPRENAGCVLRLHMELAAGHQARLHQRGIIARDVGVDRTIGVIGDDGSRTCMGWREVMRGRS